MKITEIRAALFDLDGTLVATNEIDSRCFTRAFQLEFGADIDADWSRYRHCTDQGIAVEAFERVHGRCPSATEIDGLKARFVGLLAEAALSNPDAFRPLPGAIALLDRLLSTGWQVRIATGAWRVSADVKLAAAGLPREIPISSCEESPAREGILAAALASVGVLAGEKPERVVAIGDQPWDVAAAGHLGLPFVGIGRGVHAAVLRAAGATVVLPDYCDPASAAALLACSLAPATRTGG